MRTRYFTTRSGSRLAYVDQGHGAVVAFSHGLLMSKRMYAGQIEALSESYRCIAWDHPGQGESDTLPGGCTSMETCTELASELLDSLAPEPVHFVGLSMGGFVGLRLAARRPDRVRSLALLATTALEERPEAISKYGRLNLVARIFGVRPFLARRVMPILFGKTFLEDPARADLVEEWTRQLMANRRRIYRCVNGVTDRDSVLPEVGRIRAPTLQLHGEEDAAIPRDRAEATAAAIAGARFERVPRAGHSMTVEEPLAVSARLSAFLAAVEG